MKNNIFLLFLITLFFSCSKKNKVEDTSALPALNLNVPQFKADSAFSFIEKQVEFGPRVPNTTAHQKCGNYLIDQLKSYHADITVQEFEAKAFDGNQLKLKNIVGSFKPENPKRILLAAHWDSRPFADKDSINPKQPILGANDGGSGVGVLLEVARVLSTNPEYNVGVDIVFFDGEDYGDTAATDKNTWCLGSQYWSKQKHKPNYGAYYGILLDMVGAKGAKFSKEEFSMRYARQIVYNVWETAYQLGYGAYFIDYEDGAITDDHRYVNEIAKIPMIDIIELQPEKGFGDYHHTHRDNMSVIDKNTLKAVGQTILYMVYNEGDTENI